MPGLQGKKVLLTGAYGFLGRYLKGHLETLGASVYVCSRRSGYDLRNEAEVLVALTLSEPDVIIHLAVQAGGIGANGEQSASIYRDNTLMGLNLAFAAALRGAKFVTVAPPSVYPKNCSIPFQEELLLEGIPEGPSAMLGLAKRNVLECCRAYREQHRLRFAYLILSNLYGPGWDDERTPEQALPVIPALVRRLSGAAEREERSVTCWGTGRATRSFLYVEDAARAVVQAATVLDDPMPVNIPGDDEIAIVRLAEDIAGLTGYHGKILWDKKQPEGPFRVYLAGERAMKLLGFKPKTTLEEGLKATVSWFSAKTHPVQVQGE